MALHKLQMISYVPQKASAQLTFITPRYPAEQLPLAPQRIEKRKALTLAKGEAVIRYVQHTNSCRMQLLLEYFGETAYKRCRICDVCIAQKR